MNKELKDFVKNMIQKVSVLEAKMANEVDAIWDRNYDSIVDLVVDESCGEKETCYEKETHDMIADVRTMFYSGAENYSFVCERCGHTFYGKPFIFHSKEFCRKCRDASRDECPDED